MVTTAEPLPPTLLSLPRFAQILGINPVHFAGGVGPAAAFPLLNNRCNDVWPQYGWQYADNVSRYALAEAIESAEQDITTELGWSPAPQWVYEEVSTFPRYYRKDFWRHGGRNIRRARIGIRAAQGKIISPGRRGKTLISTATVAGLTLIYSDEDGDGFFETATITATTTLTNAREIKVFIADTEAYPGWRIRPARSRSISGTTFTAVFDSWLFIDPDLLGAYPSADGYSAIDLSTVDNYVTSVDVYRIYTNTALAASEFSWGPTPANIGAPFATGYDTAAGELTLQEGTLHVRDAQDGIVVPEPATYDEDTKEWTQVAYTESRDPDMVKLWYYAGDIANAYLGSFVGDPLPQKWARAIAQLAVARPERELCECGNSGALTKMWQINTALTSSEVMIPEKELSNPFGTRYGEILAWRTVRREKGIRNSGGAL